MKTVLANSGVIRDVQWGGEREKEREERVGGREETKKVVRASTINSNTGSTGKFS